MATVPLHLEVSGCGAQQVNGVYHFVDEYREAGRYQKEGADVFLRIGSPGWWEIGTQKGGYPGTEHAYYNHRTGSTDIKSTFGEWPGDTVRDLGFRPGPTVSVAGQPATVPARLAISGAGPRQVNGVYHYIDEYREGGRYKKENEDVYLRIGSSGWWEIGTQREGYSGDSHAYYHLHTGSPDIRTVLGRWKNDTKRNLGSVPGPDVDVANDMNAQCMIEYDKWCVTPDQFIEFLAEVDRVFPNEDPNAYTVCDAIIRPRTRDSALSYAVQSNREGLKITYFVNHAWSEGVKAFGRSILKLFAAKGPGNLWICFLANPQTWPEAELGKLLHSPLASPFVIALKAAEAVISVRNTNTNLYTRLWCVLELLLALNYGKPVWVVGPHSPPPDPAKYGANAECSNPRDADMIHGIIKMLNMDKNMEDLVNDLCMQVEQEVAIA